MDFSKTASAAIIGNRVLLSIIKKKKNYRREDTDLKLPHLNYLFLQQCLSALGRSNISFVIFFFIINEHHLRTQSFFGQEQSQKCR